MAAQTISPVAPLSKLAAQLIRPGAQLIKPRAQSVKPAEIPIKHKDLAHLARIHARIWPFLLKKSPDFLKSFINPAKNLSNQGTGWQSGTGVPPGHHAQDARATTEPAGCLSTHLTIPADREVKTFNQLFPQKEVFDP